MTGAEMTNVASLTIWPRHLYSVPVAGRVGYCASGARAWFAAHGLSWADFIAHGIPAAVMTATGDPLALALVVHAQEQEASHGR